MLSVDGYNAKGMAIVCPITSTVRGSTLEVALPAGGKVQGVVLTHQVKAIDWKARGAVFALRVEDALLEQVTDRLKLLCGLR